MHLTRFVQRDVQLLRGAGPVRVRFESQQPVRLDRHLKVLLGDRVRIRVVRDADASLLHRDEPLGLVSVALLVVSGSVHTELGRRLNEAAGPVREVGRDLVGRVSRVHEVRWVRASGQIGREHNERQDPSQMTFHRQEKPDSPVWGTRLSGVVSSAALCSSARVRDAEPADRARMRIRPTARSAAAG